MIQSIKRHRGDPGTFGDYLRRGLMAKPILKEMEALFSKELGISKVREVSRYRSSHLRYGAYLRMYKELCKESLPFIFADQDGGYVEGAEYWQRIFIARVFASDQKILGQKMKTLSQVQRVMFRIDQCQNYGGMNPSDLVDKATPISQRQKDFLAIGGWDQERSMTFDKLKTVVIHLNPIQSSGVYSRFKLFVSKHGMVPMRDGMTVSKIIIEGRKHFNLD